MKRHFATLFVVFTIVVSLALFEFTPAGAARKDTRSSDKAGTRKSNRKAESKKKSVSARSAGRKLAHLVDLAKLSRTSINNTEDDEFEGEIDPDLPSKKFLRNRIDKEEYQRLRSEHLGMLRGLAPGTAINPMLRGAAIVQMQQQEHNARAAAEKSKGTEQPLAFPNWTELGPRPLPNGQTQQFPTTAPMTGRATVIVTDPTNSNKIYLGSAQGGVWRSLDGGITWTAIFDSAQSLAIGALTLAPSDPTILYVGTGEPNNSGDSFFGVGLYRIENADTTASLVGPINPAFTFTSSSAGNPMITTTCFGGRSISKILVHPTDPATIFVSTATGISGIGANAISNLIPPLGLRGVYRSTNATAAPGSVTFTKLVVADQVSLDTPGTGNTSIFDMVMEPGTPANLLVSVAGSEAPGGGVFRSTNALGASPTFTQTLTPGFTGLVMTLAINKVGSTVTAYVASNEPSFPASGCGSQSGRVRKSTDGGATWSAPLAAAEGYCGGQCAYDNPVGVDPNDANIVYLGGNARGTCSDVLKRSSDGGTTFVRDDTGLHADGHNFAFDTLTTPTTVWYVTDGGVFKRQDAAAGTSWSNQNNGPLSTVQFQSLAVHPTDQFFTIGGTQDNGTEAQTSSNGNWVSAESGDGGFALIDQSATDTTSVTMYHTFFNQTNNLIGFDRTNLGACLAQKDSWEFRGFGGGTDPTPSCDGTPFAASNGISASDTVLFYAPMALGPGTPNTLYFGTDRLYRSNDKGDTMTVVSQAPFTSGGAISAIGVADDLGSPGVDDLIRVVGLRNGSVFVTTTGGNPLTDASFPIPNNANNSTTNRFISRIVVDRTNPNIAYVTLAYYTNPVQQQVWRTTNLNAATPTWTVIQGSGLSSIPNIPINAFVIDPLKPSRLFAGTDIGVYVSENSGTSWSPYGQGLPRAAVFDMAIQPTSRLLRAATHGRGMWEIDLFGPTAAPASISGAVTTATGLPLAGVAVHLKDGLSRTTTTDINGRYHFDEVRTGDFYTVTPELANYRFTPGERSFSLVGNKTDAVFTAIPDAILTANAIDTTEYFVRQQYLDFLEREPDQGGFDYWTERINECGIDIACVHARRIDVAAAFFVEREFQETGSFIYRLYRGALGRRLTYAEFSTDRPQVVGGPNLEASKTAFTERFVSRPDFVSKYQTNQSAESFVTALLQTISATDADLSTQQTNLISLYNSSSNLNESRSLVLRAVADNADFAQAVYNEAFVLMEYFGYLRRDPDQRGYDFWLDVVTNRERGNYRGMVCAFITSTEYQLRFSSAVTRSNTDCSR